MNDTSAETAPRAWVPLGLGVLLGLGLALVAIRVTDAIGEPRQNAAAAEDSKGAVALPGKVAVKYSFAQQGEDLVIGTILRALNMSPDKVTYLDIGAWDPVDNNNTFTLYLAGSHGVLVEPNPAYTEKLRTTRPKDVVLPVGIGTGPEAETSATYYKIAINDQLNTFSKEEADAIVKEHGPAALAGVMQVKLLNINHVIDTQLHATPDVLSIDVEGLDLDILKSLDFKKYRPAVICVETLEEGTRNQRADTARFLVDNGYVLRGMTWVNSIYVDSKRL